MYYPFWIFLGIFVVACTSTSTEFHKLQIHDSDMVHGESEPHVIMRESYVVSNIPTEMDSLVHQSLVLAKSKSWSSPTTTFWFYFDFYRETSFTPRNFVETSDRAEKIRFHGSDYLLGIVHGRSKLRDCWFVHVRGREGQSPLDTCVDLASPSRDSARVAP